MGNTEKPDRVARIGKYARECRRKERRNQGTNLWGLTENSNVGENLQGTHLETHGLRTWQRYTVERITERADTRRRRKSQVNTRGNGTCNLSSSCHLAHKASTQSRQPSLSAAAIWACYKIGNATQRNITQYTQRNVRNIHNINRSQFVKYAIHAIFQNDDL